MSDEWTAQVVIIGEDGVLDFDPRAAGGEYDPGEAYRYDLASGGVVYLGPRGEVRILLGNTEIDDPSAVVWWRELEDSSVTVYRLRDGTTLVVSRLAQS